jgi:hypothetical protein
MNIGVSDGVKTDETCQFYIQLPRRLNGSSIRYRLDGCRSRSRIGLPGPEGSWPHFEEVITAGADFGRICPHDRGKTVVFKPATFYRFRNDADSITKSD